MVDAQQALVVGQGALKQRDRLIQAPNRLIGVGQVDARGQGVGVIGAKHPLTFGQSALKAGIASSRRPDFW